MKGALHTDDLDNIMSCMANPKEIVDSIETAVASFGKENMDMQDVMMALTNLGMSMHHLVDAIKKCDNEVTARELKIMMKMIE